MVALFSMLTAAERMELRNAEMAEQGELPHHKAQRERAQQVPASLRLNLRRFIIHRFYGASQRFLCSLIATTAKGTVSIVCL